MTDRDRCPPLSLVKPWTEGPETELCRTRIFTVTQVRCTSATRRDLVLDAARLRCPDWVNVVAITPDGRMVLIEQFRHGIGEVTLEIPGGMVDPPESPEAACARELLEETGYSGDPVRVLGVTAPNPAFQTNRLTTGLVLNARAVQAAAGDGHEEIGVRLAPVEEVHDLVRRGVITHSLVVAALHLLALRGT